jgi:hypothetical protein
MADISKCKGTGCPVKKQCYRFTAKENILQSYFTNVPFYVNETKGDKIKIDCGMYWGKNKEQIFSLFHKKPIE